MWELSLECTHQTVCVCVCLHVDVSLSMLVITVVPLVHKELALHKPTHCSSTMAHASVDCMYSIYVCIKALTAGLSCASNDR